MASEGFDLIPLMSSQINNQQKKYIYLGIKQNKWVYKTGELRYSMTITNRPIVA